MDVPEQVRLLIQRGVHISAPWSVEIGPEVNPDNVAPGVVLHAGCRITGSRTLILSGCRLGAEAPVTLRECQLGTGVELKGGYFRQAVFLAGSNMGSGAHVREGTIVEEAASGAHTVGLKQTILFPFVTLGSLINFCDCLMAGGTGRQNHSEVGSSYIHFNYTPNQDKATPSMLGDVPEGVMLNQSPIFLGGQGGLVGPCRLAFGSVVAAGSICRKDELRPGRLIIEGGGRGGRVVHQPGLYYDIGRPVINNLIYIGNLLALRQWYVQVRGLFVSTSFPQPLHRALTTQVDAALEERIKRLDQLSTKMEASIAVLRQRDRPETDGTLLRQREFQRQWPRVKAVLQASQDHQGDRTLRDGFLKSLTAGRVAGADDYLTAIQNLDPKQTRQGTVWLSSIWLRAVQAALAFLPGFSGAARRGRLPGTLDATVGRVET